MKEKVILCFHWLAHQMAHHTSFLSRQCDIIAYFSLSTPIKNPSKWIAGAGWEGLAGIKI